MILRTDTEATGEYGLPTVETLPTLRGTVSPAGTWKGKCDVCGWKLLHGAFDVTKGPEHVEHRISHCNCRRPGGYMIGLEREAGK